MIIKNMTASFGTLENETLELKAGMNIVGAANESGKSTWCAFIKSMLYGVDSSAREKGGVKPDKLRYSPWSGLPMAGSMDVEYEGRDVTLTRQGRSSAPMRDFSATLSGTGERVGIPPNAVGETLLGVSRDVFERSAFIGQGAVTVSGSPEIEKRIAAVVQTGDESCSVTQTQDNLKKAINRRRHHKTGLLPELEAQMAQNRAALAEIDRAKVRGEELKTARAAAMARRAELTEKAAESRKLSRQRSLDALGASRERIKALEVEVTQKNKTLAETNAEFIGDVFGEEEPAKCRAKAEYDLKQNADLAAKAKKGGSPALNIALLSVFAVAAVLLAVFKVLDGIHAAVLGILAIVQAVRLARIVMARSAAKEKTAELLKDYECDTLEEIAALPEIHADRCARRDAAQRALSDTEAAMKKACAERDELDKVLLSDLDFTAGDSEAARLTRLLEQAESELRVLREETAAWEGRQSALGSPEELNREYDELKAEHDRLSFEYEALTLALETLNAAGAEIQNRMTPELSRLAAEYFSRLTAGRYDAVLLDRNLAAAAKTRGDTVAREHDFLSLGATDQLYLAVRLAVCALALPEEKHVPVVLDDALMSFDDERCGYAIDLLRELSADRQIILFTCHSRESDIAAHYGDVNIISK